MGNNSLMTNEMIEQIKQVMGQARTNVAKVVNNELITAYWNIVVLLSSTSKKIMSVQLMENKH